MKLRVTCSGCDAVLCYDTRAHERAGICPECEELVLPPDEDEEDRPKKKAKAAKGDKHAITEKPGMVASEDLDSLRNVLSLESHMEDLEREGKSLAREHGIHMDEELDANYDTKAQLDGRLAELKGDLPEAASAYQPSGKLPMSALAAMLWGTAVAAGAAVVAELIAGAIAAAVIALMALLNVVVMAIGCIWFFAIIIFFIVGVIAYAAPFFLGGCTAAWVTTAFGRLGKNRNESVAALLSVLAAALSIGVVWIAFVFFGRMAFDSWRLFDWETSTWLIIGHVLMGIGLIIAMITAYAVAADTVQSTKFCEKCEEFMQEAEVKSLQIGGIKTMVQALDDDKVPIAASLLVADKGQDGKVTLYTCPCCSAGYVELNVQVNAKYMDDGSQQDYSETWRVASAKLNANEVEWFWIFSEQLAND